MRAVGCVPGLFDRHQNEGAAGWKANASADHQTFGSEGGAKGAIDPWRQIKLPVGGGCRIRWGFSRIPGVQPAAGEHKREERCDEGGAEHGAEPGPDHLGKQFAPGIAAFVMGLFVGGTPEEPVLWNREDQASAGPQGAVELQQNLFVLLDVLQHIERADPVERGLEREEPGVRLEESAALRPAGRELERFGEKLRAHEFDIRKCRFEVVGDKSSAAPDLAEGPALRQEAAEAPFQEEVSFLEPEVAILLRG